jgi:hypothetical protein
MKIFKYVKLIPWLLITPIYADTIDHYINIATSIPKMEMKADSQSQSWARSARNVLNITNETIAETLTQVNQESIRNGKPLFCLSPGKVLNSDVIASILLNTYNSIASQPAEKDKMTISQVAWLGVNKEFPCKNP